MSVHKKIIPISGMHCRSCELILEDAIGEIPGITQVRASTPRQCVEITFGDREPNEGMLEKAIVDAGYTIGVVNNKKWFSSNFRDYVEVFVAVWIVIVAYIIIKFSGLLDSVNISQYSPSIATAVLIGLTAGVSTCMALVGGLVLSISASFSLKHPEASRKEKFIPHLFFNAGRILSFVVLGGIIGWLGGMIVISSWFIGGLIILAGIVMFVLGISLIGIFPRLSSPFALMPKCISKIITSHNRSQDGYSHKNAFISGALTFFLPCGFTQAMQVYAISTGSFLQGGLAMGLFALGTLPGLIGVGGLTSFLKGVFARWFFRFVGVLVIVLGLLNINNGFNVIGYISQKTNNTEQSLSGEVVNNVQVIHMTQYANGYSPRSFTLKKNMSVRWVITSETGYSCAAFLIVPTMNIQKNLTVGENIIEFTPTKTGKIKFSCSMGMYTGSFTVID